MRPRIRNSITKKLCFKLSSEQIGKMLCFYSIFFLSFLFVDLNSFVDFIFYVFPCFFYVESPILPPIAIVICYHSTLHDFVLFLILSLHLSLKCLHLLFFQHNFWLIHEVQVVCNVLFMLIIMLHFYLFVG